MGTTDNEKQPFLGFLAHAAVFLGFACLLLSSGYLFIIY